MAIGRGTTTPSAPSTEPPGVAGYYRNVPPPPAPGKIWVRDPAAARANASGEDGGVEWVEVDSDFPAPLPPQNVPPGALPEAAVQPEAGQEPAPEAAAEAAPAAEPEPAEPDALPAVESMNVEALKAELDQRGVIYTWEDRKPELQAKLTDARRAAQA